MSDGINDPDNVSRRRVEQLDSNRRDKGGCLPIIIVLGGVATLMGSLLA